MRIEPVPLAEAASAGRARLLRIVVGLGSILAANSHGVAATAQDHAFPRQVQSRPATTQTGFKMARNFSLSFDHNLGAAEAKRRVAARLETLRSQFADKVGSSSVTWNGNEAQVNVSAFAQNASGHVTVSDTNVLIQVHLPLLLSPLGGKIESFLTNLAAQTLQP